MAGIVGSALAQVKGRLDQLVATQEIEQTCRHLGHRWRKRLLDPATTVHLMLLQLLAGVAMAGLRHVARIDVSAQALCRAKMRLPLALLTHLVARSAARPSPPSSQQQQSPSSDWRGHPVALADGTGLATPDTPDLADRYGRPGNHKGASRGFPAAKLLAALDLHTGLILKVIALPWARQERACLTRLLAALARGTILLGDRGLVGFAQLALMHLAGVHGLLRLPRQVVVVGRGKGARRRLERLGKQDLLVSWVRQGLVRPKWMSRRRWLALGPELTLRQIAFRITRPGYRTRWAWVVTTLTDPAAYPAEELVALYARRWQVEVCFRELKQGLGLTRVSARTVAGVRKEVLAFVLLYNLVRQVMLESAARQAVTPDRVSFTDALRWLLWSSSPQEPPPTLRVNKPRRHRPTQPRMLKHARKRYTQLNRSRQCLLKPPCQAKL